MSEIILRTKGLRKVYGKQAAVDGIDLVVERGSIYGLIGKNGAGKTTTLKMIGGLAAPTSGSLELFGKTGSELGMVRNRVSCLIEDPGLYGNMTAEQNMLAKCLMFGIKDKKYVSDLLALVGLLDELHGSHLEGSHEFLGRACRRQHDHGNLRAYLLDDLQGRSTELAEACTRIKEQTDRWERIKADIMGACGL